MAGDDSRWRAGVFSQPVGRCQAMHGVGGDGGGEMGAGEQAAGTFQAGGDDHFEAGSAGAQGEFDAGQQAVAGQLDDEAADRRVAEEVGVEEMDRFVDGQRECYGRLQILQNQNWVRPAVLPVRRSAGRRRR